MLPLRQGLTRWWGGAQDKILSMDPTQITYEMVSKKLREIVTSRGKKGIDRNEQVEMLVYLASVAKGPCQQVRRRPCRAWARAGGADAVYRVTGR